MREYVDLTGPEENDVQEIRVRRVRPDPDDDLFVGQTQRPPPPLQHMPVLAPPPQTFAELGRNARVRPVPMRRGNFSEYQPQPHARPHRHANFPMNGMWGAHWMGHIFEPPYYNEQLEAGLYTPIQGAYPPFPSHRNAFPPTNAAVLQHVLAHSMLDVSARVSIDPEKIRKPALTDATEGYTRNMNEECDFLCAKCDHVLGEGEDKSALIFYRNCGHVYCGSCVETIGGLQGKAKKCSAANCSGKRGQKIVFKQVYA